MFAAGFGVTTDSNFACVGK